MGSWSKRDNKDGTSPLLEEINLESVLNEEFDTIEREWKDIMLKKEKKNDKKNSQKK